MSVYSPRDFGPITPEDCSDNDVVESPGRLILAKSQKSLALGYPDAVLKRPKVGALSSSLIEPLPIVIASSRSEQPVGGISKRIFDIVIAGSALFLLAPVLAIIAICVVASTKGGIFYRHRRVGFGGRSFYCLKFRTMVSDSDSLLQLHLRQSPAAESEWKRARKLNNDPRVTRLGYFLRKTSLDELPQFFNIIVGDMSCVGPRPVISEELDLYGARVHDYLKARPGITGLWQVSGRSSLSYDQRTYLDSKYVREWSWGKDLAILMRTPFAVLKTESAA